MTRRSSLTPPSPPATTESSSRPPPSPPRSARPLLRAWKRATRIWRSSISALISCTDGGDRLIPGRGFVRDARDRLDVPADVQRRLGLLLARLRHLLDALEHLPRVLDDRVERAAGLVDELAAAREMRRHLAHPLDGFAAPPPRSRGSPGRSPWSTTTCGRRDRGSPRRRRRRCGRACPRAPPRSPR